MNIGNNWRSGNNVKVIDPKAGRRTYANLCNIRFPFISYIIRFEYYSQFRDTMWQRIIAGILINFFIVSDI